MSREVLLALASEAARDPSRAAPLARYISQILADSENSEGQLPLGYLYAGAHKFFAIAEDVAPEPLEPTPGAAPITNTRNRPIQIRIPFDVLVIGVAGWAEVDWRSLTAGTGTSTAFISQAHDYRDFFSCDWELDGKISFITDGQDRLMVPAAVCVGTQLRPRALAWTLRRNQLINVRFRNLLNAFNVPEEQEDITLELRRVSLAFYALNLEAP